MPEATCSIDGCERPADRRGWCGMHYQRWWKTGDPLDMIAPSGGKRGPRIPTASRFWTKVDRDGPLPEFRPDLGPCWLWLGATDPRGYGMLRVDGKVRRAHRWSYEHHVGPIPEGLQIDHLCRVPACVNPAHLEPVTSRENTVVRGVTAPAAVNARKTHCPQGHPYSGDNLVTRRGGGRLCRICRRTADLRRGDPR